MISSGWRENRKKIHGKNIYISKDNYKDEERRLFIEKIAAEFVRRSKYKIDLQNKDEDIIFYKAIPVKECTNYDFINCNIYIEGIDGSIDTRSFNNLEAIRNCIFSSCTLVSCYENAIQFRYCEINNCIYDCQLEQLDFSQCFIDNLHIIPTDDEEDNTKCINDELSFNSHFDCRAISKIDNLKVDGKVNWFWLYNTEKIIANKIEFTYKQTLDIGCYDADYIFKLSKDKKLIAHDFTIHDYTEELHDI